MWIQGMCESELREYELVNRGIWVSELRKYVWEWIEAIWGTRKLIEGIIWGSELREYGVKNLEFWLKMSKIFAGGTQILFCISILSKISAFGVKNLNFRVVPSSNQVSIFNRILLIFQLTTLAMLACSHIILSDEEITGHGRLKCLCSVEAIPRLIKMDCNCRNGVKLLKPMVLTFPGGFKSQI
jgi:hypothetical protein